MSFDAAVTAQQEKKLVLNSFTSATAFDLGIALREHIKSTHGPEAPVVIQITAGSSDQLYFFATCGEGSNLDNKSWVERKKASVVRWGISTASMRNKYKDGMPLKYGTDEANYATHGGGFPLRVKGVEPLVGVVVVSGLKQEDDHQVIVDVLTKFVKEGK